jgi:hypothetical protein
MTRLVVEALVYLVRAGCYIRWRGIERVCEDLNRRVSLPRGDDQFTPDEICRAVDIACVLYYRRILCLQRSTAAALQLRQHGYPAELILGARIVPFRSHAWVELNGVVVNDRPYVRQIYRELSRVGKSINTGATL